MTALPLGTESKSEGNPDHYKTLYDRSQSANETSPNAVEVRKVF